MKRNNWEYIVGFAATIFLVWYIGYCGVVDCIELIISYLNK